MQYDNYQMKVEKVADAIRFVLRHMVKIVIVASLIMATIVTLLITKGIITDSGTCPQSIIYGEKIDCNAKAFMAKVSYEYADSDKENWSEYMPKLPGTYRLRVVSSGTFGFKRYSEPHVFEIAPRALNVIPVDHFIYGEKPEPNTDGLVPGDRIISCEFDVLDMTESRADLVAKQESIVIKDSDGKDVTASYAITTVEKTVSMTSRPITIKVYDKIAQYTGYPISSDAYDITEGSLLDGEVITLSFDKSLTDVGEIVNTPIVSIVDKDGNDVKRFYYITEEIGKIQVTKRPLSLLTATKESEYDDTEWCDTGYELTDSTTLADGHRIEVAEMTSVKNVGVFDNRLRIEIFDAEDRNVTSNYEIAYTYGTLSVIKRIINVKTASNEWVYNDELFFDEGFEIVSDNLPVEGHTLQVNINTAIKSVGSTPNILEFIILDADGNEIDKNNYEIIREAGTLTVVPKALEIYTKSNEWTYDSTDHTYDECDQVGLLPEHTLMTESVSSIRYVGSTQNDVTYRVMKGYEDVTENYSISYTPGTLTVIPAKLTYVTESMSWEYDGDVHSHPSIIPDGVGANDSVEIILSATIRNVPESGKDNVIEVKDIVIRDNVTLEDVTANYVIECVGNGTLTIEPRSITVSPESVSKVYNGKALEGEGAVVTVGSLVNGHNILLLDGAISGSGADVNVDGYRLTIDVSKIKITDGDDDVTCNYDITAGEGTLHILPRPITITTGSKTWVYNDEAYSFGNFEISPDTPVVEGHVFTVDTHTSITNVGHTENYLTFTVKDADGKRVSTDNYKMTLECGTLKVDPRPVKITTASTQWTYNDEEFFDKGFEISPETPVVDGHVFSVDSYATITNVGEVDNTLAFNINDKYGDPVDTGNYEFVISEGKLRVDKLQIFINTDSEEWVYDSEAHSSANASIDGLLNDHDVEITQTATIRYVGEIDNVLTYMIFKGDVDVTENYDIIYAFGKLKITKATLNIETLSYEWVYDATEHSCLNYYHTGLGNNDAISIKEHSTIVDVGTTENVFTIIVNDRYSAHDVTDNYNVEFVYGNLTVTKRPVTIKPNDTEKIYDSTFLGGSGVKDATKKDNDRDAKGLLQGHQLFWAVDGGGINAGVYDLVIRDNKVQIVDESNVDVTHNYEITIEKGTATIKPRPIVITTNSAEKLYDGKELVCEKFTVTDLVAGHKVSTIVFTGVAIEPLIEVKNTVDESKTVIFNANNEDVTSNYSIKYVYGDLIIKALEFTLTTPDKSWIYDAEEHYSKEYTIDTTAFGKDGYYHGYTLTVADYTIVKNAGQVPNELTVTITNTEGEDVTRFFDINYVYGFAEIERRQVPVFTDGKTFEYDGKYHSHEVVYGVQNIVPGHEYEIDTVTEVRDVSTYVNEITLKIFDGDEDVTFNYEFKNNFGRLLVTPRKITLITESAEYIFDGEIHSAFGECKVSDKTPLAEGDYIGESYPYVSSASGSTFIRFVGTVANKMAANIYRGDNGEECTSNYLITYAYGEITVVPRPITLMPTGEWVYDGTPFSADTFVITEDSPYDIVEGNYIRSARTRGSITNVGSCESTIVSVEIVADYYDIAIPEYGTDVPDIVEEIDVTYNYDITFVPGEITVTKRVIDVISESAKKVYDGEPLINSNSKVSELTPLANGDSFKVNTTGIITMPGTVKNTFDESTAKVMRDGVDVTENYTINFIEGDLVVTTAAEIIVNTASASKTYDGTPLTDSRATYSLATGGKLVAGDWVEIITTGTITEPGSVRNTATVKVYDKNGNDVTAAYKITVAEGILKVIEINIDTDGDGTPDVNVDVDGDMKPDINIDNNFDNYPDINVDTDRDGDADINIDSDGNGKADVNVDINKDGIPDKNIDTDGDGIPDTNLDDGSSDNKDPGKLDPSGDLGAGNYGGENLDEVICYLVRSEKDGKIYLRFKSFGNYNGQGFNPANDYHRFIDYEYSAFYLASLAIQNGANVQNVLEIVSKNNQFVLPYYTVLDGNHIQSSDVTVSGNALNTYNVSYFDISSIEGIEIPKELEIFEMQYREYVYANYLYVKDDETLALMREIIAKEGFDLNSPTVIADVAYYISHAAVYNLDYNRALDESENAVVSFLTEYKEGVCRHYAASAVMLYRALGIPARYTIGYVADAEAGQFVPVSAANAHAWVEIYVNGIGWVMVEVTGSSPAPDVDAPSWGTDPMEKETITISPVYVYKKYDSMPLYAENRITADMLLSELLEQGYTYEVLVSGSRTDVGEAVSVIESFRLYDRSGNDVTDNYNVVCEEGKIEVIGGDIIKIFLYEIQKYYDGKALKYDQGSYEIITELPAGVTLDVYLNISMTDVGQLTNSDINNNRDRYISYKVWENGADVTQRYVVIADVFDGMDSESYVPIRVDARPLELTSNNASKRYDGTALVSPKVIITMGSLADGNVLYADASGSITERGNATNTINMSTVRILDQDGNDVTDNYDIKTVEGTLTVF